MDRIFRSTPNGILTAHSEWLPGVWLRHSVPLVQYIQRMVRVGGCPVVVTQWQSTGPTSQLSWVQFPMTVSLFTSSIFASKTSTLSLCPSSLSLFPKLLLLLKHVMYYVAKYFNMIGQYCTVRWDTASVHQTLPSLAEVGLVCETRHCHAFHLCALYCSY